MTKPTIQQIDNFFDKDDEEFVTWYCEEHARYRYGEFDDQRDDDPADPTGVVHDVFSIEEDDEDDDLCPNDTRMVEIFTRKIEEHYPGFFDKYVIYRMYINCFAPREYAYFHTDCSETSDQITYIYYPNPSLWEYDITEGGWTEFHFEEEQKIMGVIPTPNSMSMFTSTLSHRATPFKSHHRFSVAIKTVDKREVPDLCG